MKSLLGLCIAGLMNGCGSPDEGPQSKFILAQSSAPLSYVRETQSGNFLAGQFAQRHQDWDTASQYIGRVLDYDPDNIELQKRAMILAMGSGETGRATANARKVLEFDAQDPLALLFVTIDAFERQKYQEALDHLAAMPEGSIAEFIRPILMSWAKAGLGKLDVSALTADSPLNAYHALLVTDYLGKTDSSLESKAEAILQTASVDAYELEKIADILARHGKTESAAKLYNLLLQQQDDNDSAERKAASLKDGEPVTGLKPVQTPEQGAAEALFDMSRVLFRELSNDSAMIFTRLALQLNPGLSEARLMLAHVLSRSEHYEDSIASYLSVEPGNPFYKDARRAAADLLERHGRADDAITTLENLYAETKDVEAVILIGDLHRRAERYEDAVTAYNRAEKIMGGKIKEEFWNVYYTRGMTYERLGAHELAESDLLAALKYKPDHPYLLNYLGYSWADQGKNLNKALELIEKAAALRPDDGYIADSLGWVLYRLGRFEEAVPYLEHAVEMLPYDSTINDHLGDGYWQVGRRLEARFQWNRAINHSEDTALITAIREKIDSGLATATPAPGTKEAKIEKDGPLNP